MSDTGLRTAIFGVGGLGGLLACHLLNAGEEVCVIGRGEHLAAIRKNGLVLERNDGETTMRPAIASDDPAEVGVVDLIVLATKTDAVPASLQAVAPMIGPHTRLLTVQNGLEAPLMAAEAYGEQRILASTVHGGGYTAGPGRISLVRQPDIYDMAVGELAGGASDSLERVVAMLQRAGIPTVASTNIQIELWSKFGTMCAFSGIGALTRVPAGVWRSLAQTRALAQSILEEAAAVAQAHGVQLSERFVAEVLAELDEVPAKVTFSMQRDVMQGKPSELNYLLGTLVRFGEKVQIQTPVAAYVYYSLLPQELQAQGQIPSG